MCIILYHRKTKIPNHLNDCIAKIKQYSNIPIFVITDQDFLNNEVTVVNTNRYDNLKWLDDYYTGVHYRNDNEYHMWRESSYRFFYIKNTIEEYNLSNILTFDNDVLLYENPEKILEQITQKYKNIAITPQCHNEVVMGMCYLKDSNSIKVITDFFVQEYKLDRHHLKQKYKDYPTEMRILANIKQIEYLPILPNAITENRYSNNYSFFNSVFDPAGYGMYIGGLSPMNVSIPNPGWYHDYQEIGKQIKLNKIKIFFENHNPYLLYGNDRIKINNLHIHSKETYKYM